ncbi:glycosyltransferase family 4 protein [Pseudarthrobacter sp. LMD1-1-1.1]
MLVGIVSQWYDPEPVLIPKTLAEALVHTGSKVNVLTGYPSYPTGEIYPGFKPLGSSFESREEADVLRVKSFLSHDRSAVKRICSFLSFALSSTRRSGFLRSCDVVYVYGTPMTAAVAALLLKVTRRVPYVIHIQDLWPESVVDSGMVRPEILRRLLQSAIGSGLKPLYDHASHIVVISPGMKRALVDRGVPAHKVSVTYNWHVSDADSIPPAAAGATDEPLHFVYAGNIGAMQDVETIVRAAASVQNELKIRVSIYGSGVAQGEVQSLARQLGANNVTFMGRIDAKAMPEVYQSSDFQLVTLKNRDVFRMTIPSKFQASMAHGVPVITTVGGDLAKICRQYEVGFVAEPEDPSSLAQAFRAAVAQRPAERHSMSRRAQQLYRDELSARSGTDQIIARLSTVADENKKTRTLSRKFEERANAS